VAVRYQRQASSSAAVAVQLTLRAELLPSTGCSLQRICRCCGASAAQLSADARQLSCLYVTVILYTADWICTRGSAAAGQWSSY
jgi:hypothetical protein